MKKTDEEIKEFHKKVEDVIDNKIRNLEENKREHRTDALIPVKYPYQTIKIKVKLLKELKQEMLDN